jgi:hypothetical protein
MCGQDGVLTADTGTLTDTVGPEGTTDVNYFRGTQCQRAIVGPAGTVVQLSVTSMALVASSSTVASLKFYRGTNDGSKESTTALLQWDNRLPPKVGHVEVMPTNAVVVYWTVSSSISYSVGKGWDLAWSFLPATVNVCEADTRTITFDDGTIMDDSSTSGSHANNVHCDKTITAPKGKEITFTFSRTSLYDSTDCVYLYDNAALLTSELAAKVCGSITTPPPVIILHSGSVHILWKTGSYSVRTGWSASWKFTDPPKVGGADPICGAGNVLSSDTGTLTDTVGPNGATSYFRGTLCERSIVGPVGSSIHLTVKSMSLAASSSAMATLSFYQGNSNGDGGKASTTQLFSWTKSNSATPPTVGHVEIIPHNAVVVRWITTTSAPISYGWDLAWKFEQTTVNVCEESKRVLEYTSGIMTDPSPTSGTYASSKTCAKTVKAPAGKTITVTITQLSLYDNTDCLEMFDNTEASGLGIKLCGSTTSVPNAPSIFRSGAVTFKWTTSQYSGRQGFEAEWSMDVATTKAPDTTTSTTLLTTDPPTVTTTTGTTRTYTDTTATTTTTRSGTTKTVTVTTTTTKTATATTATTTFTTTTTYTTQPGDTSSTKTRTTTTRTSTSTSTKTQTTNMQTDVTTAASTKAPVVSSTVQAKATGSINTTPAASFTLLPTAPTGADPCNQIMCSTYCTDECGWSLSQVYGARFLDRHLHSRMPLVPMAAHLKRACV